MLREVGQAVFARPARRGCPRIDDQRAVGHAALHTRRWMPGCRWALTYVWNSVIGRIASFSVRDSGLAAGRAREAMRRPAPGTVRLTASSAAGIRPYGSRRTPRQLARRCPRTPPVAVGSPPRAPGPPPSRRSGSPPCYAPPPRSCGPLADQRVERPQQTGYVVEMSPVVGSSKMNSTLPRRRRLLREERSGSCTALALAPGSVEGKNCRGARSRGPPPAGAQPLDDAPAKGAVSAPKNSMASSTVMSSTSLIVRSRYFRFEHLVAEALCRRTPRTPAHVGHELHADLTLCSLALTLLSQRPPATLDEKCEGVEARMFCARAARRRTCVASRRRP